MQVGSYTIEERLGEGAAGVVFRAHTSNGEPVALKLLKARSKGALERFAREREALAALGDVGFVPLLDAGQSPQGAFVVMPLLVGGTLEERLRRGGLPLDEVARLAGTLARALAAAHAQGLVHRDLKPANVLFDGEGEAKIADLGLAKHFDSTQEDRLSRTGELRGTPGYMAPEQMADAKHVGPAADVFAWGAVVYECLTGRPAFAGHQPLRSMDLTLRGEYEPLQRLRPDVTPALRRVVEGALQADPGRRFPDGGALLQALEDPQAPRRWWPAAAFAFTLLALAATGWMVRVGSSATPTESPAGSPAESPTGSPPGELTVSPGRAAAVRDVRERLMPMLRAAGLELQAVWGDPRGQHIASTVGFTPQGEIVSAGGTIRVWSLGGRELRSWQAQAGMPRLLAANRLVGRTSSGLIGWDLSEGRKLWRWDDPERKASFWKIALSADGSLVAWGTSRGLEVREFGAQASRWIVPPGENGWLAFGPDNRLLYTGGVGEILVHSLKDGRVQATLLGAPKRPRSIQVDPTGRWLACVGDGAFVWDLKQIQRPARALGKGEKIHALTFSPDGAKLFLSKPEGDRFLGRIEEWDLAEMRRVSVWPVPYAASNSLAISKQGVLVGCDPRGVVWAMRDGVTLWPDPDAPFGAMPLAGTDASGRRLLGGHQQVVVWDTGAKPVARRWRAGTVKWGSLAPSGATAHIVTVSPKADELRDVGGEVVHHAFSAGERRQLYLTGDKRGLCRDRQPDRLNTLWEWTEGELKAVAELPGGIRRVLPLDADRALVVCLAVDGEAVGLWRRGKGWTRHQDTLRSVQVALSWDRRRYVLASRSPTKVMRLRVIEVGGRVVSDHLSGERSSSIGNVQGNIGAPVALSGDCCAWLTRDGRLVIARQPELKPQVVDLVAGGQQGWNLVALPGGFALGTRRGLVLRLGVD